MLKKGENIGGEGGRKKKPTARRREKDAGWPSSSKKSITQSSGRGFQLSTPRLKSKKKGKKDFLHCAEKRKIVGHFLGKRGKPAFAKPQERRLFIYVARQGGKRGEIR